MSHKFLLDASFHALLNSIDQDLAEKERCQRCCHCGGPLHQANYPRSPFGLPLPFREGYEERYSFCCGNCRKRRTPPSVKFFGRRWFPAPVLALISLLKLGITEYRLAQVHRHLGIRVSLSTWKRWRRWWRDCFVDTPFWKYANGLTAPLCQTQAVFPRALFDLFSGTLEERMCLLLKFFAPMTAGAFRAV